MSYFLTAEPCRIDGDPPSENRVVGLDAIPISCNGSTGLQPLEPHQEIGTTDTTTVSGILYWLSPDPLGEFADPAHNLYRFVGNNPLNAVDPDGLEIFEINNAVLAGTSIRMPEGVTPYFSSDKWYQQPAAQTYNIGSFAVNFAAGAIQEAWENPEALGFAMMAVAAEARFIAQGANWVRGGISKCANSQVLGDTALKGVSDDMLVHFSQTGNRASIANSGVTTKGEIGRAHV